MDCRQANRPAAPSAFCSWSGGKDSALSLHHALRAGIRVRYLLTMMTDDGERSRSHGLSRRVLERQAASLNIPIIMVATSWERYEANFEAALRRMRASGVTLGVFGDIDVAAHRSWVERVCGLAAMRPLLPLWQRHRRSVMDELMWRGFSAVIVAVRDSALGKAFLGRSIDEASLAAMQACDIDICGENGEYHTFVTMGPDCAFPVDLGAVRPAFHDGYWVLSD